MEEGIDHKFTIEVPYEGETVTMDVMPVDDYFRVTYQGKLITEATNDEMWYQGQSELIDDELFNHIIDAIESYYE